jgi:hypothetical protein
VRARDGHTAHARRVTSASRRSRRNGCGRAQRRFRRRGREDRTLAPRRGPGHLRPRCR